MKYRFLRLFFYSLLSLILISCQQKNSRSITKQQILRLNLPGEPLTLDPRRGSDLISSTVQFMLFNGLTRMSPSGKAELALAGKVTISKDLKTYTFFLRECQWSNGDFISAHDFVSSWQDMLSPGFPCPNSNLLYPIKNAEKAKKGEIPLHSIGIQALDNRTLVVELEKPTPYFLELVSFCVFFPVQRGIANASQNWAEDAGPSFLSSGPFLLKEWRHNDHLTLIKNPLYWDAKNTHLETIEISLINHESTALELFEKGELDILGAPFSDIPIDAIPSLIKTGNLKIHPTAATSFCAFNVNVFPFTNIHIRRAFALSIDRQSIVDNISQMEETVATNLIPISLKKTGRLSFFKDADFEEAKNELSLGLAELNITIDDLQNIPLIYKNSENSNKLVQALQQQWKQNLGIHIQIEGYEYKSFLDKLAKRDFSLCQFHWIAQYNDLMNILDRFKNKNNIKNYMGWEDPLYAELLEASSTASSKEERLFLLESAERILIDSAAVAPLFHWNDAHLCKPYLKDLYVSPMGSVHIEWARIDYDDHTKTI